MRRKRIPDTNAGVASDTSSSNFASIALPPLNEVHGCGAANVQKHLSTNTTLTINRKEDRKNGEREQTTVFSISHLSLPLNAEGSLREQLIAAIDQLLKEELLTSVQVEITIKSRSSQLLGVKVDYDMCQGTTPYDGKVLKVKY